jgi:hypothetical protein
LRQLTLKNLTADEVAQAYPLIRTSFPEVTLEAWRRFVDALVRPQSPPRGGFLTVLCEQGYIAGLCSYRIEPDLLHGQVLAVDLFVAYDLFDRSAIAAALAEGLERTARDNGCQAVHTHLIDRGRGGSRSGLVDALTRQGHEVEFVGLCKSLPAPA